MYERASAKIEGGEGEEREKTACSNKQLPLSSSPATMALSPKCHTLLIDQWKSMTRDKLSIALKTNSRAALSSLVKFGIFNSEKFQILGKD